MFYIIPDKSIYKVNELITVKINSDAYVWDFQAAKEPDDPNPYYVQGSRSTTLYMRAQSAGWYMLSGAARAPFTGWDQIEITVEDDTPPPPTTHLECVGGRCIKVIGVGTNKCSIEGQSCNSPPPPTGDKYYNCVSGRCVRVSGTAGYKNDSTCQGKCTAQPPPDGEGPDWVGIGTVLGGIGALVTAYVLIKERKA